jgi:flagellar biosynthesis chaperone FliJ
MTNEERQKLLAFIVDLRALEHDDKADLLERMADEIERLAEYKQKVDEALRSVAVNGSTLGSGYRAAELIDKLWQTVLQHDNETALLRTALKVARDQNTSERLGARIADELERLDAENRQLKKSLHHMSSARETDMGTAE